MFKSCCALVTNCTPRKVAIGSKNKNPVKYQVVDLIRLKIYSDQDNCFRRWHDHFRRCAAFWPSWGIIWNYHMSIIYSMYIIMKTYAMLYKTYENLYSYCNKLVNIIFWPFFYKKYCNQGRRTTSQKKRNSYRNIKNLKMRRNSNYGDQN